MDHDCSSGLDVESQGFPGKWRSVEHILVQEPRIRSDHQYLRERTSKEDTMNMTQYWFRKVGYSLLFMVLLNSMICRLRMHAYS